MLKLLLNIWLWLLPAAVPEAAEETLEEDQQRRKLKIELGQRFREDDVKIYVDQKPVYRKVLSTPDSAELTDAFEINKPKQAFTLTVEINGAKFEKSSPKKAKELDTEDYSLLINYDRETEEVEIKTKTVIVLYD